jgi:polysaccharide pyruvyl transferase WcaK-like protein
MSLHSIALYGLFGVRNLGNEATLAATLAALRARRPHVRVTLVSQPPGPEAALGDVFECMAPDPLPLTLHESRLVPARLRAFARAFLHLLSEPVRAWRTRRAARRFQLFLVPGTGIADDFGQGPFDAPCELARWGRASRRVGARVRFASIGAGPVAHWLSRRWFAAALRCADFRTYREVSSLEFARSIDAAGPRDAVLPDLVFSLPLPPDLRLAPEWPPRTIGVGVMGYSGWNVGGERGARIYADYLARLTRVVDALLAQGLTVRLLIGNRSGDLEPVRDLMTAHAGKPGAERLIAPPIASYVDVLREIAACDLVVATRFHNVLKACKLGRPVVSIGYASKNDDLMREMDLGRFCHGIETFDPQAVLAHVREIAAMPAPPTATMTRKVAEYRAALDRQFDELFEVD